MASHSDSLQSPNAIPPRTSSTGMANGSTSNSGYRNSILRPVPEAEWVASSSSTHRPPSGGASKSSGHRRSRSSGDVIDRLAGGSWSADKEKIVLGPYEYMAQHPGKDIRTQLIRAFNVWLKVPDESLTIIAKVVLMLHTASLLCV